jgi:hypothetical protein
VVFWRAEDHLTRAAALVQIGAVEEARPHTSEGLRLFRRCGARHRVAWGLELAAAICAANDPASAVRWWGAAAAIREQASAPIWPVERPYYEARVAAAHAALGDTAFEAAWMAGQALPWEQAADDALERSGDEAARD